MPVDNLPKNPKGGVAFTVNVETLNYYRKLPTEQRLRWLEEANEFIFHATSEKIKKTMEKFRRGEI